MCACVAVAFGLVAQEKKGFVLDKSAVAEYQARVLKRTGGNVTKPWKGFVAIVNQQRRIPAEDIRGAAGYLSSKGKIDVKVVSADSEATGATMVIHVVDTKGKSAMTAMPYSWAAVVNVDALAEGLRSEKAVAKFLPTRTRKEILRAFAYAAGAGGSSFPGNILDVVEIKELDLHEAFLPEDAFDSALEHLKRHGIVPSEIMTYREACQEGWAPAPTNDVQKKVWDEIHALPAKPIKIKYDPKRDK